MSNVESIDDHMAFVCGCGSVKFNLLKSGKIECYRCGERFGSWSVRVVDMQTSVFMGSKDFEEFEQDANSSRYDVFNTDLADGDTVEFVAVRDERG